MAQVGQSKLLLYWTEVYTDSKGGGLRCKGAAAAAALMLLASQGALWLRSITRSFYAIIYFDSKEGLLLPLLCCWKGDV